ncbi:MAG: hypothetical protein LBQ40_07430 [Clostridiales bacterium]|jgi:hypothetical protein|nr:hypothetical protein [Clostridiales bacterium]
MKKKVTLLVMTVSVVMLMAMLLSSCSLIVAGKYSGGAASGDSEAAIEGVFEFKANGDVTYKGKDADGNDIDFAGTFKVTPGKDGINYVAIEGEDKNGNINLRDDSGENKNTFWGVATYFEGRKQILVYWDGSVEETDAYVYKR